MRLKGLGFTLLEMLLVIVVLGIVIALASPNFSKGFARIQLNKTTDDILSSCRWAQAMAMAQQHIYALSFTPDKRSYHLTQLRDTGDESDEDDYQPVKGTLGRLHFFPDAVRLNTDQLRIDFYTDGTIDPATFELNTPEDKAALTSTKIRGMMIKDTDA